MKGSTLDGWAISDKEVTTMLNFWEWVHGRFKTMTSHETNRYGTMVKTSHGLSKWSYQKNVNNASSI